MSTPVQASRFAVPSLGMRSAIHSSKMIGRGVLKRRRDRIDLEYAIEDAGTFRVFRETVSSAVELGDPTVLIVGFQLKLIQRFRLSHWVFQRLCILTTPFWCGFPGFQAKLWLVDSRTGRYLGIYDWRDGDRAKAYADALVQVLRPLSTRDSVWYQLELDEAYGQFLERRAVESIPSV